MSIRAELNELRAELEALKAKGLEAPLRSGDSAAAEEGQGIEAQLAHLMELASGMLDEAEDSIVHHPKAAIAGALALGLVIGRLTAR